MKPQSEPVDASRLPELARAVMERAPFPMMATVGADASPRVRPVSPVRTDGFVVWVASLRSSAKTAELEAEPRVELCYLDQGHDQVRISGRAEQIDDPTVKRELFESNPLLRSYLGSPENPEFLLYRVDPERVRFMREWALEYFEVPSSQ